MKTTKQFAELPWPEKALAHDPVALAFFAQLAKSCGRPALQLILARIVTPELRGLDSWEQAADGLTLRKIAALARQAQKFTATLERTRRTLLVTHLADRGLIPTGDLLHPSSTLDSLASISRIDELARQLIGPLKRPDFRQDIEELLALIKKHCGRYHYDKLEQILAALGHPVKLKQFRSDQRRRTAGKKHRP